jgi:Nucleotidyl transferase AbiEii toxin, Type IV TA system
MATTSPGSRKWRTSDWRALLRDAIDLLDTLKEPPRWSFGGGTSLAIFYDHRISYDIDIFVANSDTLTELSPARNPATKDLLAGRSYQFPGNYLKLQLESGEIDFIVAGRRTTDPVQRWAFEGREIDIDTPWETAIKKMFYRPSTFKVRDAFDLAAVVDRHAEQLRSHLIVVEDRLDKLIDRLDALAAAYENLATDDINPTQSGTRYATGEAIQSSILFLVNWRDQSQTRQ